MNDENKQIEIVNMLRQGVVYDIHLPKLGYALLVRDFLAENKTVFMKNSDFIKKRMGLLLHNSLFVNEFERVKQKEKLPAWIRIWHWSYAKGFLQSYQRVWADKTGDVMQWVCDVSFSDKKDRIIKQGVGCPAIVSRLIIERLGLDRALIGVIKM